jgi:hypothetical protein
MENSRIRPMAQALLDSIGPRLTGSPQMKRAQDWAVGMLESWGVDAGVEDYGTWVGWDRGISHIDLVEPRVRSLEGRILAWSPGTGGTPVEGPVVAVPAAEGTGDFQSFLETVDGRYVMLSYPEPSCRPDEQWEEVALPGSYQRMREEREEAEQAWNRYLQ